MSLAREEKEQLSVQVLHLERLLVLVPKDLRAEHAQADKIDLHVELEAQAQHVAQDLRETLVVQDLREALVLVALALVAQVLREALVHALQKAAHLAAQVRVLGVVDTKIYNPVIERFRSPDFF